MAAARIARPNRGVRECDNAPILDGGILPTRRSIFPAARGMAEIAAAAPYDFFAGVRACAPRAGDVSTGKVKRMWTAQYARRLSFLLLLIWPIMKKPRRRESRASLHDFSRRREKYVLWQIISGSVCIYLHIVCNAHQAGTNQLRIAASAHLLEIHGGYRCRASKYQ